MDSKSVKQAVMQQVQNETNLANARLLIEVGPFLALRPQTLTPGSMDLS